VSVSQQVARPIRRLRAVTLLTILALLAGLVAAPAVTAAPTTRYVALSGSGGGSCLTPDYNTIAAAVAAASAGDAVHVCAGTYTLAATISVPVDLSFAGDGAATTIIDGAGSVRLFVAPGRALSFADMTLRGGSVQGRGGAISAGSVVVSGTSFVDNRATPDADLVGGFGGAIYSTGPVLVTRSTFAENAAAFGGAVFGFGIAVTVDGSTFAGNTATGGPDEMSNGGAIYAADITVANSSFSGNSATAWGGAIMAGCNTEGCTATLTVTSSTFVGNTTGQPGAAISTSAKSSLTLTDTILAQASGDSNCSATTKTDGGGNLSTDSSCGLTKPSSHVVSFASLHLGALADNGGQTQTVALGFGSTAIDGGVACPPPATDQRGVARPQGRACDAGAYEAVPGYLRVTSSPALPTQVSIDGVIADSWGLNWVEVPPGSSEVCSTHVEGWTQPACTTVTVIGEQTTTVTGTFTQRGSLRVVTSPPVAGTISVDGIPRDAWGMWTDLPTGSHQVCFGLVKGFTPPACQAVGVSAGAQTTVTGTYTVNAGAPAALGVGTLRVTTSPALPSQISLDGVIADSWGLDWVELAPGIHTICYSHVEGYTEPACDTETVTAGQTTTVAGSFTQRGSLRVITSPAVAGTISVDGIPRDAWGMWTDLPTGAHEVCFGPVAGHGTPACQNATLAAGALSTVTGTYQ
jgi:predicted outer membrane repeat protein